MLKKQKTFELFFLDFQTLKWVSLTHHMTGGVINFYTRKWKTDSVYSKCTKTDWYLIPNIELQVLLWSPLSLKVLFWLHCLSRQFFHVLLSDKCSKEEWFWFRYTLTYGILLYNSSNFLLLIVSCSVTIQCLHSAQDGKMYQSIHYLLTTT